MKRRVLLDSNMLISAFDHDPTNPAHVQARKELRALLADSEVSVAITPLVSFEVLRKPTRVSPTELEAKLNRFQNLKIGKPEAHRAAELFRLARDNKQYKRENLERLSFDIFHCVCAESNDLEIVSKDGDIPFIQQLITDSRQ
ncbi:MAG: PIN domain-containing protein [Azoarcus sp.]|jgi:predicted nucleic acid-binding protein|nr:PIN domain-containing protein [Azoarcus sp.]